VRVGPVLRKDLGASQKRSGVTFGYSRHSKPDKTILYDGPILRHTGLPEIYVGRKKIIYYGVRNKGKARTEHILKGNNFDCFHI